VPEYTSVNVDKVYPSSGTYCCACRHPEVLPVFNECRISTDNAQRIHATTTCFTCEGRGNAMS
jgi:hypothetical protein